MDPEGDFKSNRTSEDLIPGGSQHDMPTRTDRPNPSIKVQNVEG